jgi:fermentation-respiration switch protein FrsA (DUF1100 family)
MIRRIAAAVLIGAIAALAAVIAAGVALSLPARSSIGAAPAELHAETVVLTSPSGAALQGWFIPGRAGRGVVILLHGVRANRLSMLPRARLLIAEGLSVFLFDFQAHGESGGNRITFGQLETLDAAAAVAYVRRRLPDERIGVIGASLGGAAALVGHAPLPVDAIVLEAVYPDIGTAIDNRVRVILGRTLGGLVGPAAAQLFVLILPPILGIDPAALRPIDRIGEATAAVLVVSGTHDTRTTMAQSRAMFTRAREPKAFWAVDGAGHVDLQAFAPDDYRRHVLAFLFERLQRPR